MCNSTHTPANFSRNLERERNKYLKALREGDFYQGVEWLACWLLDNVEGETITEEQLRPWAQKAWFAHLDRENSKAQE